jgi:putative SOS response-associated peptidase YedK
MCNLYRQRATENLSRIFEALPYGEQLELKPDTYPKYDACVIRKQEGARIVDLMAWGIITTIKGKSGKPIQKAVTNVRNLSSPFWRSTLANPAQRCLVPFTSFAEPKPGKDPETGRPANHWFTINDREACAFAGIWRFNEGRNRFAFLTCEPNPLVAPLHEKAMPVILDPDDYDRWLDGEVDDVCSLATPFPSQLMAVA